MLLYHGPRPEHGAVEAVCPFCRSPPKNGCVVAPAGVCPGGVVCNVGSGAQEYHGAQRWSQREPWRFDVCSIAGRARKEKVPPAVPGGASRHVTRAPAQPVCPRRASAVRMSRRAVAGARGSLKVWKIEWIGARGGGLSAGG